MQRLAMCLVAAGFILAAAPAQALAVAAPATGSPRVGQLQTLHVGTQLPECKRGYYKNVSGRCVKRPSRSPAGATAKCRDGTYSYFQHASGTCSHHGGVARWIHHP